MFVELLWISIIFIIFLNLHRRIKLKNSQDYKQLSIKEFTKAAQKYESDQAGIYKICRHDYVPILEELQKQPFTTLLDAGCGTAPMVSLLSQRFPNVQYTGLDLTPEMINQAKLKNIPNAQFIVGDCENMPFQENSFDVIINSQSFHHYPNPQAFFNCVAKVLKPGGKLILRDITCPFYFLWFANFVELPLVNLCGYGDYQAHSIKQVKEYCAKAGLKIDIIEQQPYFRLHLVAFK